MSNDRLSIRMKTLTPSPTMSLNAKTISLKKAGKPVINMSVGEPDFSPPVAASFAGIQAIAIGDTRYTPAAGIPELREAIARKLKQINGLHYETEEIVVSAGGKQPLYNSFQAICNPGDEVILPAPYWVSYPEMIRLAGAEPIIVNCDQSTNFKITAERLEKVVSVKTKAIVLTSPNNPTGSVYSPEELKRIGDVVLKHENLFVISDEIYDQITYDGIEHFSIARLFPELKNRTIIVNGFSKVFAMTGWRLGYLAAPLDVAKAIASFQSHTTGSPSTISQHAGIAALQYFDQGILQTYQKKRDLLVEGLNSIKGIHCQKPDGAFYVFPDVSSFIGLSYEERKIEDISVLCDLLLDVELVSVVPGSVFGSSGHIRMTFAVPDEHMNMTVERLRRFISKLEFKRN